MVYRHLVASSPGRSYEWLFSTSSLVFCSTICAADSLESPGRSPRPSGGSAWTPLETAYAECGPCELTQSEVDELIDTMRHSTLTREQNRELFIATFECLPCVDAILDASNHP